MANQTYSMDSAKAPLRFLPRAQRLENGMFQPLVVIDDDANGAVVFGGEFETLEAASDRACEACEQAAPAGDWKGGWYIAAAIGP